MNIAIFGLWHQGVVMASCLANFHNVDCFDTNPKNIDMLLEGKLPVNEPGLQKIFNKFYLNSKLKIHKKIQNLKSYDCIIIAHDTIVDNNDNSKFNEIIKTSKIINKLKIKKNCVLINFTQSPVGLTEKLFGKFKPCYIPENLQLGTAIHDFLNPRLPIIGCDSKIDLKKINNIFGHKINWQITGVKEAEFIKNCLNSFLAISIAYGNELGRIAKLFKLDQYQVIKLLKKDPRLSNVPLMPGVPYSGATLARDVKHLLNYIKSNKSESFHLTNRINNSNNSHKNFIFNQIALHLKKFKLKKVLFIGLTYKLGSSTMRRSVMYEFLKKFENIGINCEFYDPEVTHEDEKLLNLKKFEFKKNIKNNCVVISKPILDKSKFSNISKNNKLLSLIEMKYNSVNLSYIFK